ncbi:MAG: hypothetical protein KDA47_11025 [Planctomycetales bacterium]|nr:hypothetical protein [Planctomycetales bacterium]
MLFNRSHCLTLAIFVASIAPVVADGRTWTDRTGNAKVEAELVTVKQGKAYLERVDGRVATVALERLSDEDLKYLASLPEHRDEATAAIKRVAAATDGDPSPSRVAPANVVTERPKMATTHVEDESTVGVVRRFKSESWGFQGIAFSPDGGRLAAIGSDNINLIDLDSSQLLARQDGLREIFRFTSVTFSPDGKKLLAGGTRGHVLIWDVAADGRLNAAHNYNIHDNEVKSIAVTPDSQYAISVDSRGNVKYWSIETGQSLMAYGGFYPNTPVDAFITRRGGQALVADGRTMALFDLKEKTALQAASVSRGAAQCVAFSPDGTRFAFNDSYTIRLVDVKTGSELPPLREQSLQWSVDFSPNGKLLACGSHGRIAVWDVDTQQPAHLFTTEETGHLRFLQFSPDGIHVAAIVSPIGQSIHLFRLPKKLHMP